MTKYVLHFEMKKFPNLFIDVPLGGTLFSHCCGGEIDHLLFFGISGSNNSSLTLSCNLCSWLFHRELLKRHGRDRLLNLNYLPLRCRSIRFPLAQRFLLHRHCSILATCVPGLSPFLTSVNMIAGLRMGSTDVLWAGMEAPGTPC